MSGRNVQRKLGTTRGSPRRSRTARALRISRLAVKSRCACEWGGWGRLSDDGPGQNNPDPSEGPWGGGRSIHQAVHLSSPSRRSTGSIRKRNYTGHEVRERRKQTNGWTLKAGSRHKPTTPWEGPARKPAFQPYWGKPAVRCARINPEEEERECDVKPLIAIQRVRLPPGKGEPVSRKRALHGWWRHHS
jgi:hypothetical protein